MNHRENRSVCADTEGEREHGDGGEASVLAQHSRAAAKILPEGLDKAEAVHAVDLLSDLRGVAELPVCGVARFFRRHAAGDVFVGFDFEIGVEFALAFLVPVVAAKKT